MISIETIEHNHFDFLFECRNNPEIYKYFFSARPVVKDDHIKWCNNVINDDSRYVFVINYNDEWCGMVNATKGHDQIAEVGIYILPDFSSKGIASRALELLEEKLKKDEITKVVARVLIENESSHNFFKRNNYVPHFVQYEKGLNL